MGHTGDCPVNDGPAYLPGPCECGLVSPIDSFEAFIPVVLVGAWRGGFAVRQRNVETLIKTEQAPINHGRGVRLTIDLEDAHRWTSCGSDSDNLHFNSAGQSIIPQRQANTR